MFATSTLSVVELTPVSTNGGSAVTDVTCTKRSTTFKRADALRERSRSGTPVTAAVAARLYSPNAPGLTG